MPGTTSLESQAPTLSRACGGDAAVPRKDPFREILFERRKRQTSRAHDPFPAIESGSDDAGLSAKLVSRLLGVAGTRRLEENITDRGNTSANYYGVRRKNRRQGPPAKP